MTLSEPQDDTKSSAGTITMSIDERSGTTNEISTIGATLRALSAIANKIDDEIAHLNQYLKRNKNPREE